MKMAPNNKWALLSNDPNAIDNTDLNAHIQKALHILNKGEDDSTYLNHNIKHNAKYLNDIDKAWSRLEQARDNHEKVLVYGDYDVDGMTSTTIMAEGLQLFGIDTSYVVPDRVIDGYGPSERLYQAALDSGFTLIVTVDNGISGAPIIDKYYDLGLDVIVTDHHEPNGDMIPTKAVAKVHPMLSPDYSFNGLCGAGVAYKFITYKMPQYKDQFETLAAMGTIADVMPLSDENRRIVYEGLNLLATANRSGLKALKKVKGVNDENIDTDTIGFNIGPMLNSIGRISNAMQGVKLLMETDDTQAQTQSELVNNLNEKRKSMVNKLTDDALAQAKQQDKDHQVLLVGGSDALWHQGIVGIVAANVVEKMHKPALAMSFKEGSDGTNIVHGSARSVGDYDIFQCMKSAEDVFDSMGGHAGAAGFGLHQDRIPELQSRLDAYVKEHPLPNHEPSTKVMDMIEVADFNLDFYNELQKLAPFGENNPNPVWCVKLDKIDMVQQLGKTKTHVKIIGSDKDGRKLTVLGFFKGSDYDDLVAVKEDQSPLFVIGTMSLNIFRGKHEVQMFAMDWGNDFHDFK